MNFTSQLVLSFVVGGLFIAFQTLFAERVEGTLRSMVLTFPSTLALGLFFVGFTKTPLDVVEAVRMVPAGLGPDYLFVFSFAMLSRFNLAISLVGSFLLWAGVASLFLHSPPDTLFSSIFLYGLPLILFSYFFLRKIPPGPRFRVFPMNLKHIVWRSLLGGSIIALIVTLSHTLGNLWGGLFSTFPASFTSTFVIYYHLQGKAVIPSLAKSLFFPGVLGYLVYAEVAALSFPVVGIWWGTLLAYLATLLVFGVYYPLVQNKKRVSAGGGPV